MFQPVSTPSSVPRYHTLGPTVRSRSGAPCSWWLNLGPLGLAADWDVRFLWGAKNTFQKMVMIKTGMMGAVHEWVQDIVHTVRHGQQTHSHTMAHLRQFVGTNIIISWSDLQNQHESTTLSTFFGPLSSGLKGESHWKVLIVAVMLRDA